ncbi:M1 family metallopeptidase [Actinoplanes sp. NPDC049265]|uniref:M1 family metallopeptidase n=1 Tax=Actinoplanes sp. NPDC049265 TaxID=3363902 RepID=UPI003717BC18
MTRRAAVLLSIVLSATLAATPAYAAPAGHPGAPGLGDPYFPLDGNGGYDARHYDLAVRYAPETDVLTGVATIRARATESLTSFNLDFDGMTIRAITVDGRPATWSRAGQELTVTPRRTLRRGGTFVTRVSYDGVPKKIVDPDLGDGGAFTTDDGVVILGEPDVAAAWFPSNDHPLDKASFSIRLTVPAGTEAISNGTLAGRATRSGWTTWAWEQPEPMATYLASAVVGQFDLTTYRKNGLFFLDAIDPKLSPELAANARATFAREPEFIQFMSGVFGPYPFKAAGGLVDSTGEWGYALENQGRPIYTPGDFSTREAGDSVVVHELAHQWFGDSVALGRWSDIWLNEGFASYAEWLWSEHEGLGTAQENFDQAYARPATSSLWKLKVADPGAPNIFSGAVYTRGAMALHALRLTVGDQVFFKILRTWAQQNRGGNGTTAKFIAHAERVSGRQLDALFTTWLYTAAKPSQVPSRLGA